MRREFFARFEAQEKAIHKSIALTESEWKLLEAYKLYGMSHAGHEIPIQRLLREMLLSHIQQDRPFSRDQNKWIEKLDKIENMASVVAQ